MPFEFKLPDLGEGVAEGEIVKWLVGEGQSVKEDDPMVEVMTDKATVQIPSPATGKVKQIVAKEGQTVKVGSTLVTLDTGEDGGGAGPKQSQESKGAPAKPNQEVQRPRKTDQPEQEGTQKISSGADVARVTATPATRRMARELNVDIESIKGSGPGGRITEEDVKNAAAGRKAPQQTQQQIPAEQRKPAPKQGPPSYPQEMREERIPIHGIRKRTAEKMTKSVRTAAHVWHVDEVDYTELVEVRNKSRKIAESQGVRLTYLPFIIKAVVHTLKEFPYFNSSLDDERQEIVVKHYYNIGFATDTSNGLIVPIIKDADKKTILELARELQELSDEARNGSIQLGNLQGGTFTITNIGTLGGLFAMPIINHPEVAILGVLKIEKRPLVKDGQIVIRDVGYVSLGFDHRVVDGADAARFTTRLVSYLENPNMLLLEST